MQFTSKMARVNFALAFVFGLLVWASHCVEFEYEIIVLCYLNILFIFLLCYFFKSIEMSSTKKEISQVNSAD